MCLIKVSVHDGLEIRTNWFFTTGNLRSTDLDPARPTPLSLGASVVLLKCQVVTATLGRGRLLDASPLTSEQERVGDSQF